RPVAPDAAKGIAMTSTSDRTDRTDRAEPASDPAEAGRAASGRPSPGALIAASCVLVAAVLLLVVGGVVEGFRPLPSGRIPEDTPLPVGEEPQGELPEPPAVFRWEPGGDDVDLSQVIIFDDRRERLWQSVPLTGSELTVDVAHVFDRAAAGHVYSWSVREFRNGRPRATSPLVQFSFDVDVHGRGIGESVPGEDLFDR
ncbi:hypothetical protein K8I85_11435, partial [bacterium]|nr:hypothetical protein [bacterium]